MNTRSLSLAIAALATAPVIALAQQPTRSMNMQTPSCDMHALMFGAPTRRMNGQQPGAMGDMKGDMRGGMAMTDSSMMTRMQSDLGFTDAQMQQMHAMEQRACTAAQPHLRMAMQLRQSAIQALTGDHPSVDHFEDQLDKANKHMVEAQVAMAKEMLAFRNTLTPEQRQKMDQMHLKMARGGQ